MSKISIIVRCYNEEEHIGRLLAGISQQTERDVEIILVDSGSTDATLSIASRYPIKVIYVSPDEFSFGRALNLGCKAACGEYLVFISAHCWPVYNDWLKQLTRPLSDPTVALVYGKQRGSEKSQFSEHQIFTSWFPDHSNSNQGSPFCNNANCAIRQDLWKESPYNEELTGLEDLAWAKTAIDKGYHIAYSAEAEIVHVHTETPHRIYNRYRREAIALKAIFPQEKFTLWDFISLSTMNIIGDCIIAKKNRILYKNIKDILTFRLMQFWGAYRGNSQCKKVSADLKRVLYYPNNLKNVNNTSKKDNRGERIKYCSVSRLEDR